jgi:hypothetical protein
MRRPCSITSVGICDISETISPNRIRIDHSDVICDGPKNRGSCQFCRFSTLLS